MRGDAVDDDNGKTALTTDNGGGYACLQSTDNGQRTASNLIRILVGVRKYL